MREQERALQCPLAMHLPQIGPLYQVKLGSTLRQVTRVTVSTTVKIRIRVTRLSLRTSLKNNCSREVFLTMDIKKAIMLRTQNSFIKWCALTTKWSEP